MRKLIIISALLFPSCAALEGIARERGVEVVQEAAEVAASEAPSVISAYEKGGWAAAAVAAGFAAWKAYRKIKRR